MKKGKKEGTKEKYTHNTKLNSQKHWVLLMLHYTRYVFYQAFASYKSVCNAKMLVLLRGSSLHIVFDTLLRLIESGWVREWEGVQKLRSLAYSQYRALAQSNDTSSGGIDVKEHDDKTNKNNKKLI